MSQNRFERVQAMHDPNLLAAFASQVPYHADALLQLAMVFAHTGQVRMAAVTAHAAIVEGARWPCC